jgi:hypothetical protein
MKVNEVAVRDFLQHHGFTVTKIPETPQLGQQTPDFLAEIEGARYVVEVKSREKDRAFEELFVSHVPGEKTVTMDRKNRLSKIIEGGTSQLESFEGTGNEWKILWFYAANLWYDSIVAWQLLSTVYGLKELEGYTTAGQHVEAGCFYFSHNDFNRRRQLDAIVIHGIDEVVLCVNNFASRCDEFRHSSLYKRLELTIIDPELLEKENRCFIADGDVDRRNPRAVLEYIAAKYGLHHVKGSNYFLFNLPLE